MNMFGLAENSFHNLNKRDGLIYNAYRNAAQISIDKASITKDSVLPSKQRVTMVPGRNVDMSLRMALLLAMIGKTLVDCEVLSKFCTGCVTWEGKSGTPEYDEWKCNHVCEINHVGSSGSCLLYTSPSPRDS